MQGGGSKAQKDKPEGPSHTLEGGWACSCFPPSQGATEDPLDRTPTIPGRGGRGCRGRGRATSWGVLPNCSQVAQMEEEFPIATAKDPNNECPTPK